jgi:phosphoribosylaminoimidazole-succinocarboxamide synthase
LLLNELKDYKIPKYFQSKLKKINSIMLQLQALSNTNFEFANQQSFYRGKVRDVYKVNNKMVMIASDRISAFDVVLPRPIPYKGQVLNLIAAHFLQATSHIVPNWLESVPHNNVSIGKACETLPVEMVVRGYLSGHAWREYKLGKRILCGVTLPDGLKESDKLPTPIITPTTKAHEGHDEDISREEIIAKGLVNKIDYEKVEQYALQLFAEGTRLAAERGLILVDTKYEFGKYDNQIYVIDEIHTPDSSRYFYAAGYTERQEKGEAQRQLSKEFVRQWLIENGFQGKEGQVVPTMTDEVVQNISDRYIELFENITGKKFEKKSYHNIENEILAAINQK